MRRVIFSRCHKWYVCFEYIHKFTRWTVTTSLYNFCPQQRAFLEKHFSIANWHE